MILKVKNKTTSVRSVFDFAKMFCLDYDMPFFTITWQLLLYQKHKLAAVKVERNA